MTDAHKALATVAGETVARVTAIKADKRISESERTAQLAALADVFVPKPDNINEIVASVAGLASEAERTLNRAMRALRRGTTLEHCA